MVDELNRMPKDYRINCDGGKIVRFQLNKKRIMPSLF